MQLLDVCNVNSDIMSVNDLVLELPAILWGSETVM